MVLITHYSDDDQSHRGLACPVKGITKNETIFPKNLDKNLELGTRLTRDQNLDASYEGSPSRIRLSPDIASYTRIYGRRIPDGLASEMSSIILLLLCIISFSKKKKDQEQEK